MRRSFTSAPDRLNVGEPIREGVAHAREDPLREWLPEITGWRRDIHAHPVVTAAQIVTALQSIAARNADPVGQVVVSATAIESSSKATNVIPSRVTLTGTVRSLTAEMRDLTGWRVGEIARATAAAFGATADVRHARNYPPMGGEDFAILLGNGAMAAVQHPEYDFADEAIPAGCSYWAEIVERRLPLG